MRDTNRAAFNRAFFYQAMRTLNMDERRSIFFVLIGKGLHTLYNLEALSLSVNLTVRESDLPLLQTVLRRLSPTMTNCLVPLSTSCGSSASNPNLP